ncbi:MAG: methionyl aminopeptidase [Planctomycetota bacterium]
MAPAASGTAADRPPAAQVRAAGCITAILESLLPLCRAGITPVELAAHADPMFQSTGLTPTLRGYRAGFAGPFPAAVCVSVNRVAANGVPGEVPLQRGDLVTLDVAGASDGWHADGATTAVITADTPRPHPQARRVLAVVLGAIAPGTTFGRVLAAYRSACAEVGVHPVREVVAHGIGRALHEGPTVLAGRDEDLEFRSGQVLAVEPIVSTKPGRLETLADGWSRAVPAGGSAAYEERTVVVTCRGAELLAPEPRFPGA